LGDIWRFREDLGRDTGKSGRDAGRSGEDTGKSEGDGETSGMRDLGEILGNWKETQGDT
jgi:hypothetical protein